MLTDRFFAIAEFMHDITLWSLVILSILSVAFIIERALTLGRVKTKTKLFSAKVQKTLEQASLSDVEELSKDHDSLEGKALHYGLRHLKSNGQNGISEIFNTFALNEKPKLEKYLSFLATVGSNAPFIGLLGTVFGIMDAFRGLATSQGDASMVMIGISKALVATAVGLLVAIPAVIAYNYFQKQVKSTLSSLESVKELFIAYSSSKKG